jgi:hypothetical protein
MERPPTDLSLWNRWNTPSPACGERGRFLGIGDSFFRLLHALFHA